MEAQSGPRQPRQQEGPVDALSSSADPQPGEGLDEEVQDDGRGQQSEREGAGGAGEGGPTRVPPEPVRQEQRRGGGSDEAQTGQAVDRPGEGWRSAGGIDREAGGDELRR